MEQNVEVIRLDQICNNNCSFCFVQDKLANNYQPPLDDIINEIESFKKDSIIDIFGGEPTTYKYFFPLMDYLHKNNKNVTLATNLTKFSDEKFIEKFMKYENVSMIRTTLLGKNDETHDYYTRTKGSFDKTIKAFKNFNEFINKKDLICVNTVMLPKNINQLSDMFFILRSLGIERFKYGTPKGDFLNNEHISHIKDMRPNILKVASYIINEKCEIKIEKSSVCMAPELIEHYLPAKPGMFYDECKRCKFFNKCDGFSKLYFKIYNDGFLYNDYCF